MNKQISKVEKYYRKCWNPRLKAGHNSRSLAIHYGYYEPSTRNFEEAKVNLNKYIGGKLDLNKNTSLDILDAGCGICGTAIYLAQQFPRLKITGINISREQVELAQSFILSEGLKDQVRAVCCDYHKTPFPKNSFDRIYAIESLCHSPDKGIFFTEMARILKRGGRLVITDYFLNVSKVSRLNEKLINNLKGGWAISDFCINSKDFFEREVFKSSIVEDLTKRMLPGMKRSYKKAVKFLDVNKCIDNDFANHLRGCQAIFKLHVAGVLSYLCVVWKHKE